MKRSNEPPEIGELIEEKSAHSKRRYPNRCIAGVPLQDAIQMTVTSFKTILLATLAAMVFQGALLAQDYEEEAYEDTAYEEAYVEEYDGEESYDDAAYEEAGDQEDYYEEEEADEDTAYEEAFVEEYDGEESYDDAVYEEAGDQEDYYEEEAYDDDAQGEERHVDDNYEEEAYDEAAYQVAFAAAYEKAALDDYYGDSDEEESFDYTADEEAFYAAYKIAFAEDFYNQSAGNALSQPAEPILSSATLRGDAVAPLLAPAPPAPPTADTLIFVAKDEKYGNELLRRETPVAFIPEPCTTALTHPACIHRMNSQPAGATIEEQMHIGTMPVTVEALSTPGALVQYNQNYFIRVSSAYADMNRKRAEREKTVCATNGCRTTETRDVFWFKGCSCAFYNSRRIVRAALELDKRLAAINPQFP